MIAGNASFFPPAPAILSTFSAGLENMISFVPGVYSGCEAEGGRGSCRSYPSGFMDDHGPLCVSPGEVFRKAFLPSRD